MHICLDCLHIFQESRSYKETHGFDFSPYENWNGCPICGGAYIVARNCSQCSKYIKEDYIKLLDGDCICENCFKHKRLGDDLN